MQPHGLCMVTIEASLSGSTKLSEEEGSTQKTRIEKVERRMLHCEYYQMAQVITMGCLEMKL